MLKLDREKYIQIMRTQGLSAAITTLHQDTEGWEFRTFEGESGFQPEMWKDLEEVRNFSRELWNMAMNEAPSGPRH